MDRQIVCFAIPSLQIALARLSQPLLRTRPLAIATIDTPRALLREISTEAEQDGLHVGMTLDRARRLCPSLHVQSPESSPGRHSQPFDPRCDPAVCSDLGARFSPVLS
jgi:DNA polymerase-4